MDERKLRERSFHDSRFGASEARDSDKFYSIAGTSQKDYLGRLTRRAPKNRILEYGCGVGSAAFDLAQIGASVVGIDISPTAIVLAEKEAGRRGLAIDFRTMDAEALEFPDSSFDIVCGSGILHHLDLKRAFAEIVRVLRPGGSAFFSEPLGHNPVVNAYRNRTPEQRTPDEHPLLESDFVLAREYFSVVDISYYHLATLAAIPVATKPFVGRLSAALDSIDRLLFSMLPAAKRFAWMCVIELSGPALSASTDRSKPESARVAH